MKKDDIGWQWINGWKFIEWMKVDENGRKGMKVDGSGWKWMKVDKMDESG